MNTTGLLLAGIMICAVAPRARATSAKIVRREARRAEAEVRKLAGVNVHFKLLKAGKWADGYALGNHIFLYTGLTVDTVKGVAMHEMGHILLGHQSDRSNIPVRQMEREADFMAGYFLARSGYAVGKYARAYVEFVKSGNNRKHGTGPQRVATFADGLVAGLHAR
jgi:hypothetical protein